MGGLITKPQSWISLEFKNKNWITYLNQPNQRIVFIKEDSEYIGVFNKGFSPVIKIGHWFKNPITVRRILERKFNDKWYVTLDSIDPNVHFLDVFNEKIVICFPGTYKYKIKLYNLKEQIYEKSFCFIVCSSFCNIDKLDINVK